MESWSTKLSIDHHTVDSNVRNECANDEPSEQQAIDRYPVRSKKAPQKCTVKVKRRTRGKHGPPPSESLKSKALRKYSNVMKADISRLKALNSSDIVIILIN